MVEILQGITTNIQSIPGIKESTALALYKPKLGTTYTQYSPSPTNKIFRKSGKITGI